MDPIQDYGLSLTRRHFFGRSAVGIGAAALASLLGRDAFAATDETAQCRRRLVGTAPFPAEGEAGDLSVSGRGALAGGLV